jgi:hypothetical protein
MPCREKGAGTRLPCKDREIAEITYPVLARARSKVPVPDHHEGQRLVEITDLASHMPGEVCRYEATCKDRDIAEIAYLFLARRKARRYRPPIR